jgi:putative photosynthetic complex assembly protein
MKTTESLAWKISHERRSLSAGIGFALFLIACLALVAWVRWTGPAQTDNISARAEQVRTLRFVDQDDGSIQVIDATTGADVHNFQGEQGFVRGTLRALVRDRRLQGLGADQPFELIAHDAGRLTLRDPATGSTIALESFGSKNIGVFARLMRSDTL